MVVAKSFDKTLFLYTEHTDGTVCEAFRRMTEKFRAFRETCTEPVEVSVYKESETWTLL